MAAAPTLQSLHDEAIRLNQILLGVGERFDNVEAKIVTMETTIAAQTSSIETKVSELKKELDPTIAELNDDVETWELVAAGVGGHLDAEIQERSRAQRV